MIHLGDITKISGYDVPTVDIITGGSPCQDLSIAGKREGLSGERSGLFMEQLRIVKEMREKEKQSGKTINDIRPRYMVWENVPGAFSSNQGRDFQAVLAEIVRIVCPNCPDVPLPKKWAKSGCLMGYGEDGQQFSVAYRVHDAQFWGVPQRRKRIALVADFSGTTAPEILFERCGVQGDTTKGREEKQSSSPNVTRSIGETISFQERGGKPGGGKGILIQNEHIGAMKTNQNQYVCSIGFNRGNGSGVPTIEEKQPTIQAAAGESGNNQPLVCQPITYQKTTGALMVSGYNKLGTQEAANDMYVCQPILLESNQNHATIQTDGISTALPASMGMGGGYVPMITDVSYGLDSYNQTVEEETAQPIRAADGGDESPKVITTSHGGFMVNADDSNVAQTILATDYKDPQICAYALDRAMFNQGQNAAYKPSIEKELSQTLVSRGPNAVCARDYKGVGNEYVSEDKCIVEPYQKAVGSLCARDYKGAIVRRLTPLECERLQGFPDNWTDIGDWIDSKGKKHKGESDAPRYGDKIGSFMGS